MAMARTRQKCSIQCKGGSAEAVPASQLDAIQLLGDPQGCKLLAILAARKGKATHDPPHPSGMRQEHLVHHCSHGYRHAGNCQGQAEQLQASL